MTNQVTTPGNTRRRATPSDTDCRLACGNPTRRDAVRRNRQAWHARGQWFESTKLHVFPVQIHISILKMILDVLHCPSCRWPLTSGSGTGVLARQSAPAHPGRQPVPLEGRSPGAKVGANGDRRILPRARERVAVARQSRQPSATRSHLHSEYLRVGARQIDSAPLSSSCETLLAESRQSSSARCGWPAEEFLTGWAVD